MTQDKKQATGRHMNLTPEFRSEAVRLVMNSGRSSREIASDLGIGRSTLKKWVSAHKEKDLLFGPHDDVTNELARLRKENELLRQERDLLKKPRPSSRKRPRNDLSDGRRGEGRPPDLQNLQSA